MPVISIDIAELSKDKKTELVKGFTETASQVTGIPEEAFVVFVREYSKDNIGIGGKLMSDLR